MSAARPSEPAALAASVTSSLVLVHDPECRATAPDYWDWSADAHRTAVRALTAIDDDRVRTAAGRLTAAPADDTAAALTTALTSLLGRPGGESDAVDALRAAAARTPPAPGPHPPFGPHRPEPTRPDHPPPAQRRGPTMDTRHTVIDSGLGPLTLVARGQALTGLYFPDHVRRPAEEALGPRVPAEEDPLFAEAAEQLHDYLAGRRDGFALPLAPEGDTFQHAVWDLVRAIPHGETTTYGTIAERLGAPGLAQRVGQAVGANPLCVLVPCHRVVGADNSLTGYAGGLARKRALLTLEEPAEVTASRLF